MIAEPPCEFVLACTCCSRAPRHDDIRTKAEAIADWDRFLKVVKRHHIGGLACTVLADVGAAIPPGTAEALQTMAKRIARQNLSAVAESVRLRALFDAERIRVLFLKGLSLAQLAYGSYAFKYSGDIDLLVPEPEIERALRLLEREGYTLQLPARELNDAQRRAILRYGKEFMLLHPGKGICVELHWRLTENPLLLAGLDASAPAQEVRLFEGGGLPTLADDDLFAYLCVHGAVHAWSRLKWLADLNAFIAGRPEEEIARLHAHAAKRGAGLCSGQALLLCRNLLGLALAADLAHALEGDRRLRRLVAIATRAIVGADPTLSLEHRPFDKIAVMTSGFLLGRGVRFHLAQLRTLMVGTTDIVVLPLPDRLQFLYPILRPALWLWRRWDYLRGRAAWYRSSERPSQDKAVSRLP